ncbi:hypothetical protein LV779_11355 [Streptomyces thinghirensis]|nr:hypothetical protein [Streptomyces thinghirensis]
MEKEFTTEPFDLEEAPAARGVVARGRRASGADEVDVGLSANTAGAVPDAVLHRRGRKLLCRSLEAGATRISLQ